MPPQTAFIDDVVELRAGKGSAHQFPLRASGTTSSWRVCHIARLADGRDGRVTNTAAGSVSSLAECSAYVMAASQDGTVSLPLPSDRKKSAVPRCCRGIDSYMAPRGRLASSVTVSRFVPRLDTRQTRDDRPATAGAPEPTMRTHFRSSKVEPVCRHVISRHGQRTNKDVLADVLHARVWSKLHGTVLWPRCWRLAWPGSYAKTKSCTEPTGNGVRPCPGMEESLLTPVVQPRKLAAWKDGCFPPRGRRTSVDRRRTIAARCRQHHGLSSHEPLRERTRGEAEEITVHM